MLYAFYYVFYYFNYDCVVRSYIFIIYFDEKMFFFLKNILYLSNGPTFIAIPSQKVVVMKMLMINVGRK